MKYILIVNGCMCCGCSTFPVSYHKTKKEAEKARNALPDHWQAFGGDGQYIIWKVGEVVNFNSHAWYLDNGHLDTRYISDPNDK